MLAQVARDHVEVAALLLTWRSHWQPVRTVRHRADRVLVLLVFLLGPLQISSVLECRPGNPEPTTFKILRRGVVIMHALIIFGMVVPRLFSLGSLLLHQVIHITENCVPVYSSKSGINGIV